MIKRIIRVVRVIVFCRLSIFTALQVSEDTTDLILIIVIYNRRELVLICVRIILGNIRHSVAAVILEYRDLFVDLIGNLVDLACGTGDEIGLLNHLGIVDELVLSTQGDTFQFACYEFQYFIVWLPHQKYGSVRTNFATKPIHSACCLYYLLSIQFMRR